MQRKFSTSQPTKVQRGGFTVEVCSIEEFRWEGRASYTRETTRISQKNPRLIYAILEAVRLSPKEK